MDQLALAAALEGADKVLGPGNVIVADQERFEGEIAILRAEFFVVGDIASGVLVGYDTFSAGSAAAFNVECQPAVTRRTKAFFPVGDDRSP